MCSLLHRSTSIIISTVEVISDVGFLNLSTKEIARREGISEGTLFRHFKSKNAILLAVLDHFSQYDGDIIESCINKQLSPCEAIKAFMTSYAEYYENYPEIIAIEHSLYSLLDNDELHYKVISIINQRKGYILQEIERGKCQGLINQTVESEVLASMIIGGVRAISFDWRMGRQVFSLKDRTEKLVDALLNAFIQKQY